MAETPAKLKDKNEPLIIGGDSRADSPGHCAKFGSYTVTDLKHRNVDLQLVQVKFLYLLYTYLIRVMKSKTVTIWKKKG